MAKKKTNDAANSVENNEETSAEKVKVRILTHTHIDGALIPCNRVALVDKSVADQLVASGTADDSEDAVDYVLENENPEIIEL